MLRRPPEPTLTDSFFPFPTLFRSVAVWEAGKPHGLAPLGLEALDMLRIEAGLVFFKAEFDDQTDPFEAGIGFTVAAKGNEEFIGREAVLRRKANPQKEIGRASCRERVCQYV